jgi:hypothetical protein
MRTNELIEALARDALPVRRLGPPLRRALAWLATVFLLAVLVISVEGAWSPMVQRLADARFALEMAATLLTGLAAVIAAFYLSVPGRSAFWAALPVPAFLLWVGSSGYECYRNWFVYGPDESLTLGRSSDCFVFIVLVSVPLGAALYLSLRRAMPLSPLPVLFLGGLGVAALAATLLQFFHPFDVTVMDLAAHFAAISIVIGAMSTGRYWLTLQSQSLEGSPKG